MSAGYCLTHPEVQVSATVPVTDRPLSPRGVQRVQAFAKAGWPRQITRITCSAERKARQTADIRAGVLGLPVQTEPQTGENDRLATGFLPPDISEAAADAYLRPRMRRFGAGKPPGPRRHALAPRRAGYLPTPGRRSAS